MEPNVSNTDSPTLGEQLRAEMARRGHTQRQAMAAMGVTSFQTLRNWLHDRTTPHWDRAPDVVDYLRGGGGGGGGDAP
jgi:transcriptional regulator with XRE-family HTH domain